MTSIVTIHLENGHRLSLPSPALSEAANSCLSDLDGGLRYTWDLSLWEPVITGLHDVLDNLNAEDPVRLEYEISCFAVRAVAMEAAVLSRAITLDCGDCGERTVGPPLVKGWSDDTGRDRRGGRSILCPECGVPVFRAIESLDPGF